MGVFQAKNQTQQHLLFSLEVALNGLTIDPKALKLFDTDLFKPLTPRIVTFHHASKSDVHSGPLYQHSFSFGGYTHL